MARRQSVRDAMPWRIAPDVYCFGPSGWTQTNVYFVKAESSWTLIDAGWASDGDWIKRAARSLLGDTARPGAILLTHCHPDHSGAARYDVQNQFGWRALPAEVTFRHPAST